MKRESSFGVRLSELRKRNAMTQRDLAGKLNVHITTIKNWESDSCSPDAKNISALADLFHVTTDSLLGREDFETIALPELTTPERKQIFQMIQAYLDTRISKK